MLTPSFHVSQNDEFLIITIHAPYTQLKDVEINALGSEFWFYSSPYFLRLNFPCGIIEDDEPPATYNSDKGEFEVRLRKEQVGQHFPDLDLLGKLLAPRKTHQNIKPSIEVLPENVEGEQVPECEEEDDDEWLIEQQLPAAEPCNLLASSKYGFGNQTCGVFYHVKSEFKDIIDLLEPDSTPAIQRDELRKAEEDRKFCPEHYLADFMEPEVLQSYVAFEPVWYLETPDSLKFTQDEKETLKKLGNKEYLLSKEEKAAAWLSLVDILFAYAYNHRTTLGENTVESAWTINKISATLSWFSTFNNLHSVIISGCRRMLTYPLVRNWDLAQLVLKDTIAIMKLGRRKVLKCFLELHSLFSHSEPRYMLNQLYISDYCIWLQQTPERKLANLTEALEQVTVLKSEVGFDLEELEHAALIVQQEYDANSLANEVRNLKINGSQEDGSSDNSSDSEDSSFETSSLDSDDDSNAEECHDL